MPKEYTIIAIHNHPGSSVPSLSDIIVAQERKYGYGIVACHDGVYISMGCLERSIKQ